MLLTNIFARAILLVIWRYIKNKGDKYNEIHSLVTLYQQPFKPQPQGQITKNSQTEFLKNTAKPQNGFAV